MEKYRNYVMVEQIKDLVREDRKEEALALAEQLDVLRIRSNSDLNIIANLYLSLGMLTKARACLLELHSRRPGRNVVMQLVNLAIRLKDATEAEYFAKEFSKMAPDDYYNYIFRYSIDKMECKPLSTLIESLEQLRDTERIESWDYELAKLYHKSGDVQKCLDECRDIEIWFGEGEYVDKARALAGYYTGHFDISFATGAKKSEDEALDEAHVAEEIFDETEVMTDLTASLSAVVEDVLESIKNGEDEEEHTLRAVTRVRPTQAFSPVASEQEEEEAPAVAEEAAVEDAVAEDVAENVADAVAAEDGLEEAPAIAGEAPITEDAPAADEDAAAAAPAVVAEEIKISEDVAKIAEELKAAEEKVKEKERAAEGKAAEEKTAEEKATEDRVTEERAAEDKAQEYKDISGNIFINEGEPAKEEAAREESAKEGSAASNEIFVPDTKNCYVGRINPLGDGFLKEFLQDRNKELKDYFGFLAVQPEIRAQIIKTLDIMLNPQIKNISMVITGGKFSGKKDLCKGVVEILHAAGFLSADKYAVTDAMKINGMNIKDKLGKLTGSCLVIDRAGALSERSGQSLLETEELTNGKLAVILIDQRQETNKLFRNNRDLNSVFPNRIHIPEFDREDLEQMAYFTMSEEGYTMTEEARELLIKEIDKICRLKNEGALFTLKSVLTKVFELIEVRGAKNFIEMTMKGIQPQRNSLILAEDIIKAVM